MVTLHRFVAAGFGGEFAVSGFVRVSRTGDGGGEGFVALTGVATVVGGAWRRTGTDRRRRSFRFPNVRERGGEEVRCGGCLRLGRVVCPRGSELDGSVEPDGRPSLRFRHGPRLRTRHVDDRHCDWGRLQRLRQATAKAQQKQDQCGVDREGQRRNYPGSSRIGDRRRHRLFRRAKCELGGLYTREAGAGTVR